MAGDSDVNATQAWEFSPRARVTCIALSATSGSTLVVAEDGRAHVLDRKGKLRGGITLPGQVRCASASDDGESFAALTQGGKLVGFSAAGEELWTIDVGQEVSYIDIGRSGRRIAMAKPPYDLILVRPGGESTELKCRHCVASLALAEGEPDCIVAAGALGELSLIDERGATLWQHSLGTRTGPVRLSPATGILTAPAFEEGLHSYALAGEGAGAFDVGQSVIAASSAVVAFGTMLAALTEENCVMVMDMEGLILWHHRFNALTVDFDITDDAALLVAITGEQKVVGMELDFPGGPALHLTAGADAQAPAVPEDDEDTPWVLESEDARQEQEAAVARAGVPRPDGATLLAERQLPQGRLPRGPEELFVTPQGHYVLAALPGGEVLALTRQGEVAATASIEPPVQIRKKRSDTLAAAWNPALLLGVEFTEGTTWQIPLGAVPARYLDCAEDLSLIAWSDDEDTLTLCSRSGTQLARRTISSPIIRLLVAPGGKTVMIEDAERRFRLFDRRGNLRRKLRLAGEESFNHVVLEDGFCAFGSSKGRVIVQDMGGGILWTDRLVEEVVRMESLQNALAIYGADGQCLALSPYGEILVQFRPPPGMCALRIPQGRDPVLVHARNNVLTVFGGYQRKLNALWRFECEAEIEFFETDRDASLVVLAAGESLYLLEGPEGESAPAVEE